MIATAGTVNVTVTTSGGTSAAKTFTINPAAPTITALSPSSATAGGAAFTLTVTGTNFISGATVKWGTTSLTTTVSSTTTVTAPVTAAMIATAGTVNVTVTTTAGTSSPMVFTINNNLTLTLTGTTLPSGTVGSAYSGSISATGSVTQTTNIYNYIWKVNGTTVSTNGTPYTLSSGISFTNTGGWTLSIGGTPNVAGTVTFSATITACTPSASGCQPTAISAGPATFSIVVGQGASLTLPPSNTTFPSATVGQSYGAAINASGGDQKNYTWTVNGNSVPISGTPVTLPDGIAFSNTGGFTLTIGGTPTAAGTATFSVSVTDVATGATASQSGYSITVNGSSSGHIVNGGVTLANCGGGAAGVTVTINTNPTQSAVTDSNGAYSIFNIPNGSYTVTPSISGPAAVFYPASQSFTINGSDVDENFQAVLGYTVTGTVAYTGTQQGRIYVQLAGNNCGGPTPGTSLAAPGQFTIRGVPPGSYTLEGWMDTLGYGSRNASDPSGSVGVSVNVPQSTGVTVSKADASKAHANAVIVGQALNLNTPSTVTLSAAPGIQTPSPFSGGAVVPFSSVNESNGVEMATSYTVAWSTSSTFASTTGTKTFKATGSGGSNVWILSGLTNSQVLYFHAQGLVGTSAGPWSSIVGPVTINAPTAGSTVSGTVNIPVKATGPLYVGFYNQNTNVAYAAVYANPGASQSYSVKVPAGIYFNFAILDQNNDGIVDVGDLTNTNSNSNNAVTVGSSALSVPAITLSGANSTAIVTTQNFQQINQYGNGSNYNLQFEVGASVKLPVAVTLLSATNQNVVTPMDIGWCDGCGGSNPYNFQVSVGATPPRVNDSYTFQVTYSDGTTASPNPTATVTGVLATPPSSLLPEGPCTTNCNLKPTFTWSDTGLATSDMYSFQLMDSNYNTLWQIPGKDSSATFTNSIQSITYGTDPTGSGSTYSTPLSNGTEYYWQIKAMDTNGNSATAQAFYYPGYQSLSLPAGNPSTLPSAVAGQYYTGSIAATGGYPCYNFNASNFGGTTSSTTGYQYGNSCSSPWTINFTPASAGTITFQLSVSDNDGDNYGPVTYTINVLAAAPVSLPKSTPNSLGSALLGSSYSGAVNASDGVNPYTFTVNGTPIPTNNTATVFTGGNGLTAANSSGNTLFIGGTPTAGPITLTVSVTDGNGATDTETYSIPTTSGPSGVNNGNLNGQYTCLTQGFNDNDNARWASVATFKADGSGHLTSGEFDENGSDQSSASTGTSLTGTFSIGADNNGLLSITANPTSGNGNTTQWAIALTDLVSPAQQFRMLEAENSTVNQHGTANCFLDTTSAFAVSTISSKSFAFGMQGESGSGAPKAYVGRMTASSGSANGGTITSGIMDGMSVDQSGDSGGTGTGSYTAPSSTTGRFTITLTPTGSPNSITWAAYIIDVNRMFLVEIAGDTGLQAGDMRLQQQTSNAAATLLNGPFVLYEQGLGYRNGSVAGYGTTIMQGTGNGTSLTVNASYDDNNGTFTSGKENGTVPPTFDSANPGRAYFSPGTDTVYLYFFNSNTAFFIDLDGTQGNLASGWVEAQKQTTFSNATLAGSYLLGEMPAMKASQDGQVGVVTVSNTGSITADITEAGQGEFNFDQSQTGIGYNWLSNTYGAFSVSGGGGSGSSCFVISAAKSVCIDNASSTPSVTVLQQ